MKKFAVIVAGGLGSRMNSAVPKQFLLLKNKPLLFYSIESFLNAYNDLEIILVLPEEHISNGQEIIDGYFDRSRVSVTTGGRTRFHSVQNGLTLIDDESIIFVHDAVRCLISVNLIQNCFVAAVEYGTAIPVIKPNDSVRYITKNDNEQIDRNRIRLVQTPQTFHSKILLEAYKRDYKEHFTDEATVVESFGLKVHLIEGEENNIKITKPADLIYAENLLLK